MCSSIINSFFVLLNIYIYGLLLIVFVVPFAYKSVIVLYIVVTAGYKIRDRLSDPIYQLVKVCLKGLFSPSLNGEVLIMIQMMVMKLMK